ncbi:MAG: SOS response-associated peptidase family protein, partial [Elusimicrobiota bacterium]
AFAGLWDRWRVPGETPLDTFTVLTTSANSLVAEVHARMPVILREDDEALWLDPEADRESLAALLVPFPESPLRSYAVTPRVNFPENDDAACVRAAEDTQPELGL